MRATTTTSIPRDRKKDHGQDQSHHAVHWSGKPCDIGCHRSDAKKHGLAIVSDACHAIKASYKGRHSGELGTIACFQFPSPEDLNVWGDGGIIAPIRRTRPKIARKDICAACCPHRRHPNG